ncbi:MAG: hypothetical protein WBL88_13285 [Nitrososphaeraceae archaeon]
MAYEGVVKVYNCHLIVVITSTATDAATTTIKVVCVLNGSRLGSRRSIVEVMMRL